MAHYQLVFNAAQYARLVKYAVVRNLVQRVLGRYYNPIRRRMAE